MLPLESHISSILRYINFHLNEIITIAVISFIYLFVRIRLRKIFLEFLDKVSEKNRKYFNILKIFYSFPFFLLISIYLAYPFLEGPTDILKFLIPMSWAFIIYYILDYIFSLVELYNKAPFFRKALFFVVAIVLFYYYLSKPSTGPVYWLLYPFLSIGDKRISVINIIVIGVFFYFVFYFAKVTKAIISDKLVKDLHFDKERADNLLVIWEYLVIGTGILISLSFMGISLSSLLVILGSLGVGIGFGLQTIFNNFISGIMLLVDRSINPGDIITVENNMGRVIRIGTRYTVIRTFDSQDLLIPNYKFMESEVINWTRSGLDLKIHIPFSISYNEDPEKVKDVVLKIARSHPRVMAYPPPEVLFLEFGESSLNFELIFWISDLTLGVIGLKSEFHFLIFKAFRENDIEIPYPQLDIHLKDTNGSLDKNPVL